MYHINPACIKSILRSMPRKEIPSEMEKLKQKIAETPAGPERSKFIRLYNYCKMMYS